MAYSFFGGIHPKENKSYAEDKPIIDFPAPDVVVIPMSQHIGAPCQPLVKKGDLVTIGQKIGDGAGLCVPVHASVSGKVKAVELRPHCSGTMMMSVVIENDKENTLCPDIHPRTDEQIAAMKEAVATMRAELAIIRAEREKDINVEVLIDGEQVAAVVRQKIADDLNTAKVATGP